VDAVASLRYHALALGTMERWRGHGHLSLARIDLTLEARVGKLPVRGRGRRSCGRGLGLSIRRRLGIKVSGSVARVVSAGCRSSGCVFFAPAPFCGTCRASSLGSSSYRVTFSNSRTVVCRCAACRVRVCCSSRPSGPAERDASSLGTPGLQYDGIVTIWNVNRKSSFGRSRKLVARSLALWSFFCLLSFRPRASTSPYTWNTLSSGSTFARATYTSPPRELTDMHIGKVDSLPRSAQAAGLVKTNAVGSRVRS